MKKIIQFCFTIIDFAIISWGMVALENRFDILETIGRLFGIILLAPIIIYLIVALRKAWLPHHLILGCKAIPNDSLKKVFIDIHRSEPNKYEIIYRFRLINISTLFLFWGAIWFAIIKILL